MTRQKIFDLYNSLVMQYWGRYGYSDIFEDLIFVSLNAIAKKIDSIGLLKFGTSESLFVPNGDDIRLHISEKWTISDIRFLNGFVLWWYKNTLLQARRSEQRRSIPCNTLSVPPSCFHYMPAWKLKTIPPNGIPTHREQFVWNNDIVTEYDDLLWTIIE